MSRIADVPQPDRSVRTHRHQQSAGGVEHEPDHRADMTVEPADPAGSTGSAGSAGLPGPVGPEPGGVVAAADREAAAVRAQRDTACRPGHRRAEFGGQGRPAAVAEIPQPDPAVGVDLGEGPATGVPGDIDHRRAALWQRHRG